MSFAVGQGICLQADRGLFTTYRAVLFNERLQSRLSFKLEGSPSRTRISADGRVGAITIFVTGHGYASSSFSTKTMLIDMASGDVLGDLEQFTTWRDGKRFSAADFNFWGVTFARDSMPVPATAVSAANLPAVASSRAKGVTFARFMTGRLHNANNPSLPVAAPRSSRAGPRLGPQAGEGIGAWRLI